MSFSRRLALSGQSPQSRSPSRPDPAPRRGRGAGFFFSPGGRLQPTRSPSCGGWDFRSRPAIAPRTLRPVDRHLDRAGHRRRRGTHPLRGGPVQARRNAMPKQNRYNLPMEILYTIAPFIVVVVLFYQEPSSTCRRTSGPRSRRSGGAAVVVDLQLHRGRNLAVGSGLPGGHPRQIPTLYLPVSKSVLSTSPPGRHPFVLGAGVHRKWTSSQAGTTSRHDPDAGGNVRRKCAELCGTYHSDAVQRRLAHLTPGDQALQVGVGTLSISAGPRRR